MSDNIKLYKCYKGTCSKCLNDEDPYITEDEYKELLDADGKVQCPEGHLDCGIQELKPEDYPKPPKDNKKLLIISGGLFVIVLLIIGAVFMFSGKNKSEKPTVPMKSVDTAIGVTKENNLNKPNTQESKATDNNPIRQEVASGKKDQSIPIAKQNTENKDGKIDKSVPAILTASSLEDGLRKIGDAKYSQENRKALLLKVLSKFENSKVMVTVSMNNNKYEYFTVDKYLNRILIQRIKNISVKNETKNNAGLINELSVNE